MPVWAFPPRSADVPPDHESSPTGKPMSPKLMRGKRGVILGVANNRSIAWGIAKACHEAGAEIALTFQVDALFAELGRQWGKIDFVVHAIAFSDKEQLDGRYLDTTADNFTSTMLISCYSLTAIAQRA